MQGDKSGKTWKSRQDGLHQLAQGAFAVNRNIATHTDDEWPKQVAFEHLAVLSVVSRWADETDVISPPVRMRSSQEGLGGRARELTRGYH